MPDISTAVDYLLAVIDLKQVREIRNAVRANLIDRGGIPGPLGTVHLPHHPIEPEPDLRFIERKTALPAVTVPPAPVVHVEKLVAARHDVRRVPDVVECDAIPEEPHRHREHGPLVPPWKLPLVPESACDRPVIKCPPPPPDVINKGSLLDFFM